MAKVIITMDTGIITMATVIITPNLDTVIMTKATVVISLSSPSMPHPQVIQQLQLMGEVVYLKSEMGDDLIVLDPKWLCTTLCGLILSPEFR